MVISQRVSKLNGKVLVIPSKLQTTLQAQPLQTPNSKGQQWQKDIMNCLMKHHVQVNLVTLHILLTLQSIVLLDRDNFTALR